MSSDVYCLGFVLLAGGQSSRYDGNKLLSKHPVTKLPLVQHSANIVIRARDVIGSMSKHPVTVVVGKWHDSVSSQLAETFCCPTETPIEVIHNKQWGEGIASSIRSGLTHVLNLALPNTKPSHVLFTLADLPSLNIQDLTLLIDASKAYPNHIVCSEWQKDGEPNSRLTVPAIFPESMFSELLALQGDTGAKPIIKRYAKLGKVTAVSIPNAQFDIDTPQDWDIFKRRN